MRVGCCTITTLKRDCNVSHPNPLSGWICNPYDLAHGYHLKGGIQRDWGFEDIVIANDEVRHRTAFQRSSLMLEIGYHR